MIDKCLAKVPDERYQTVAELTAIMNQFLRSEFDSRQTAT